MNYTITKTAPQLVGNDYDIQEIRLENGSVFTALPEWGSFVRWADCYKGRMAGNLIEQMPMNGDGTPCVDEIVDAVNGECDPGFWEDAVKALGPQN